MSDNRGKMPCGRWFYATNVPDMTVVVKVIELAMPMELDGRGISAGNYVIYRGDNPVFYTTRADFRNRFAPIGNWEDFDARP